MNFTDSESQWENIYHPQCYLSFLSQICSQTGKLERFITSPRKNMSTQIWHSLISWAFSFFLVMAIVLITSHDHVHEIGFWVVMSWSWSSAAISNALFIFYKKWFTFVFVSWLWTADLNRESVCFLTEKIKEISNKATADSTIARKLTRITLIIILDMLPVYSFEVLEIKEAYIWRLQTCSLAGSLGHNFQCTLFCWPPKYFVDSPNYFVDPPNYFVDPQKCFVEPPNYFVDPKLFCWPPNNFVDPPNNFVDPFDQDFLWV